MEVLFEAEQQWDADRGGVLFWAASDGEHIRCFVSRNAIHDSFGGSGAKEDVIELFRNHRTSFEYEAVALMRSRRTVAVEGETFREAQVLAGRVRHRPVVKLTRRVTRDEIMGAGVAKYVSDGGWWSQASGQQPEDIFVISTPSGFSYVDIAFPSEDAALNFDYTMSKYGVRTFRLEPAG